MKPIRTAKPIGIVPAKGALTDALATTVNALRLVSTHR